MRARNNPTDKQLLTRKQREWWGSQDPRIRNDAYWALRHAGHPHAYARRAFRDCLPRFYQEIIDISEEFTEEEEALILYPVKNRQIHVPKLAVYMRPEHLTEEVVATAAPRSSEYTIWSTRGFGLRVRPSGVRTYIVRLRILGRRNPIRITLGKPEVLSLKLAKRIADEILMEAICGNDPRPKHKSGELARRCT